MPTDEDIEQLAKEEFGFLDPDWAHVNNGSFGTTPMSVQRKLREYSLDWQGAADKYYHNDILLERYHASIDAVGPFFNAQAPYRDHIALIDNATTGSCIVAQGIMWKFVSGEYQAGDVILMWDCVYGAVEYTFRHYLERLGAKFIKIPVPFPLNDLTAEQANEKLIGAMRWGLSEAHSAPIRLVLLEHVGSACSILFPLAELVKSCRAHDSVDFIYVDAAHAIGNVPIDVQKFDVDFYASNCHKWFFTPQPCAVFYSKMAFEELKQGLDLHNPVISWYWGQGLGLESFWTGTRDVSPKLVLPYAIDFLPKAASSLGLVAEGASPMVALAYLRKYNHEKLAEYTKMLAEAWGTSVGCPSELMNTMGLIAIPDVLMVDSAEKCFQLRLVLMNRFQIAGVTVDLPCDVVTAGGVKQRVTRGYIRLSHQIYVRKKDVMRLKDAILVLVEEAIAGHAS